MIRKFRGVALLLGVAALTLPAKAQNSNPLSADVAATYTVEKSKIASVDCGCFWFQGGSLDAAVPLFRGLGAAAVLTGEHSSNIAPGVDLGKIAFMMGPRYSFDPTRWIRRLPRIRRGSGFFGEALFGAAHGFDSSFPGSAGVFGSENALSMQFGGGLNIRLARGLGVRAIELDYVRTTFRNLASDSQNDFRLAFGVTYHVGGR
ncbi:MAG: hypothetical protein WBX38_03405 [Candidatus Sulfotelmatobacter sp.]